MAEMLIAGTLRFFLRKLRSAVFLRENFSLKLNLAIFKSLISRNTQRRLSHRARQQRSAVGRDKKAPRKWEWEC